MSKTKITGYEIYHPLIYVTEDRKWNKTHTRSRNWLTRKTLKSALKAARKLGKSAIIVRYYVTPTKHKKRVWEII